MSILHIFVPELGFEKTCDWALREGGSVKIGTSDCSDLPRADQTILIVAASRVLLTQVQLPAIRRNKLREMLAFAVEDKLLAEPDKIHVVAATLSPISLQGQETAVAIIDKAWLRQQLAHLQQHGIRPEKMLAETLLPSLENQAWSMVWNGQGGFVRLGPSSGIVVDGGDAHTPPMALTLALAEARALKTAPTRILLYLTPGTNAPQWSSNLSLDIEQRSAWYWQNADTNDAATLNLLQGEFAPPNKNQAWIQQLRPALMLLGLIVAVHLLATFADWARLRHEQRQLQNEMVEIFKQTFPQATAIVDPALQMQRNLAELQRSRGTIVSSDFLPLLALAAPVIHQAKIQTLQYEQEHLKIELLMRDSAQLDALREQLHTLPISAAIGATEPIPSGIKVQLRLGLDRMPSERK